MEGCKRPQRTYIYHIYIYIYIHISKTYIDAEFDVESFRMVYLASKGRLGKVICEKHTFLNSPLPSTVRVSQLHPAWRASLTHDLLQQAGPPIHTCAASSAPSRKAGGPAATTAHRAPTPQEMLTRAQVLPIPRKSGGVGRPL